MRSKGYGTWFVCLCVCLLPRFLPLGATRQPISYADRFGLILKQRETEAFCITLYQQNIKQSIAKMFGIGSISLWSAAGKVPGKSPGRDYLPLMQETKNVCRKQP
jgi:hypothetical protein